MCSCPMTLAPSARREMLWSRPRCLRACERSPRPEPWSLWGDPLGFQDRYGHHKTPFAPSTIFHRHPWTSSANHSWGPMYVWHCWVKLVKGTNKFVTIPVISTTKKPAVRLNMVSNRHFFPLNFPILYLSLLQVRLLWLVFWWIWLFEQVLKCSWIPNG